jgi:hypothetical protein
LLAPCSTGAQSCANKACKMAKGRLLLCLSVLVCLTAICVCSETPCADPAACSAGACTLCTDGFGNAVCLQKNVANFLATAQGLTCHKPGSLPAEEADSDCGKLATSTECIKGGCVWCVSRAVPSACYTKEEAERLPPGPFDCQGHILEDIAAQ